MLVYLTVIEPGFTLLAALQSTFHTVVVKHAEKQAFEHFGLVLVTDAANFGVAAVADQSVFALGANHGVENGVSTNHALKLIFLV